MTVTQVLAVRQQPSNSLSHSLQPFSFLTPAKIFFLFLLIGALFAPLKAQEYTQAIGLRVGSTNGLSFKNFFTDNLAGEALIVYHKEGFRGIGLVEQHILLGRRSNTSIYFGIGGYAGVTALLDEFPGKNNVAGITGVLGLEYVFPHTNISFGVDLNPAYELIQTSGFSGNQGALSLRYLIK